MEKVKSLSIHKPPPKADGDDEAISRFETDALLEINGELYELERTFSEMLSEKLPLNSK